MGTKICKIVEEMPEIIEPKVDNPKNFSQTRNAEKSTGGGLYPPTCCALFPSWDRELAKEIVAALSSPLRAASPLSLVSSPLVIRRVEEV